MKQIESLLEAHVLVVDDQQANVDVVADFLEMQGYVNVRYTTDSREVMDLVGSFRPDIILLDLSMPYLSGYDILEQLGSVVPSTDYLPVLVLTADVNIETKRKALLSGASDFLTKPFDLIELQARVNAHLQIRKKNEQIKEYSQQLKELIATKDRFFSIIAHDIRNPFAGIENYIRIMLKTGAVKNPDECTADLQRIYHTAHEGHQLLENLLKWSRTQTGNIELRPEMQCLHTLVSACVRANSMQAQEKEIALLVDMPEYMDAVVDTDAFSTVLRNLISNSVKFTNPGGVIKIVVSQKDDAVCVVVTDNGVGISKPEQEKLFLITRDVQTRKGTNGESGSGLGLILCAEFVRLMGGSVDVESELGVGTTVTITIPQ